MHKHIKIKIANAEIIFHNLNTILCLGYMLWAQGWQKAISEYAKYEDTVVVFKYWLVVLALGGLRNTKMKAAGIPLLGVALFDSFPKGSPEAIVHNICAIAFFFLIAISFLRYKKLSTFGIIILIGFPISLYHLMTAEILAIAVIQAYTIYTYIRINNGPKALR